MISGTDNADSVEFIEPEKACSLEIGTVVGSGHGETSEHVPACGQNERSFRPTDGPESPKSEVAVVGNSKKKIVIRTVRVVRRVIKTRVPKRVLIDGPDNQKNGVLFNKVSENLSFSNDVMENSNLDVMKNCNHVNKMNEKSNMANEVMETSNFNFDAEGTRKSERTNGMDDLIIENVNSAAENAAQSGLPVEIEAFSKDNALEENWSLDEAKNGDVDQAIDQEVHLAAQTCVGLLGHENETLMEKIGSGKYKGEEVSEDVQSKNLPFNNGLLLSGKLEALERKKRRKTEIFVGGLNKDAKEDDIWRAFEAAGEIVQVRLAMNTKKGKNKGFAFVRFATAADAKNALDKYSRVEVCGNQCDVEPVEGNDTIFLGNIDRKWKTEDVARFLEKAGVDKIEVVNIKTDPENMDKNRGFAFVEFETNKDAQIAFHKLKKKDVFGKNQKIKIAWSQPLIEPSEEEISNVKSVYVEYLPPSWDEEKVKDYFKRFGEIYNVVLSKDLASSKRKDFAFINYSTRDAAMACIEAVSRERREHSGSKIKMAASLANPKPKSKQQKLASDSDGQPFSQEMPKVSQVTMKFHKPRNKAKAASSIYDVDKVGSSYSTTDELVQLLRQQASSKYIPSRPITENSFSDYFPLHGSKRPLSLGVFCGPDLFLEPRALPRARIESYSISDPSSLSHGAGTTSFPYHDHGSGHTSESAFGGRNYPRLFQTIEQAPYHGDVNLYFR